MRRFLPFATLLAALCATTAHAQPAATPAGAKLMTMSALSIGVAMCEIAVPPADAAKFDAAYAAAAEKQQEFTPDQLQASMAAMAQNMMTNKDSICAKMKERPIGELMDSVAAQ